MVLFESGFVSYEINSAYKWVLETFLHTRCNKYLVAIVIDGDTAMKDSIMQVFSK